MNVLSLFDGISAGQVALNNIGIKPALYLASEIDRWPVEVTNKHFPNTIQLGDVKTVDKNTLPKIDLLIGGSNCQSFSVANTFYNQPGFNSDDGKLFFEYVRLLEQTHPQYFLYENVASMKASDKDAISKHLRVEPLKIDSAICSAQSRKRYYWTNIPQKPFSLAGLNRIINDEIDLSMNDDVRERTKDKIIKLNLTTHKLNLPEKRLLKPNRLGFINNDMRGNRVYSQYGKSITLTASSGGIGRCTGLYLINDQIRRLSPLECERLQTFPDQYTAGIRETERYRVLGRSLTVKVIEHLFSSLK